MSPPVNRLAKKGEYFCRESRVFIGSDAVGENQGCCRTHGYGEYAATDKAAKDRAYQVARESAAVMRLLIVDERVE